jgi:hypothetical protein
MSLTEFANLIGDYWEKGYDKSIVVPPESKFVTGVPKNDAYLHHLLTICGVQVILEKKQKMDGEVTWDVIGYNVVDEGKWAWFLLRWL